MPFPHSNLYKFGAAAPNKSLEWTFDPSPIFATAKTGVASNAAEFRRYVPLVFSDILDELRLEVYPLVASTGARFALLSALSI